MNRIVTAADAVKIALEHHKEGNFSEAESIYKQIIDNAPDYADGYYLLAVLYMQQGKYSSSKRLMHKAIELDPEHVDAYHNMGNLLFLQKRFDDSIGFYEKALQLKPGYMQVHYNLANSLANSNNIIEAEKHYLQAISLNAGHVESMVGLADLYQNSGDVIKAVEFYEKALSKAPNNVGAYNNFGNLLRKLNNTEGAIACFEKALALQPNIPELFFGIGLCYAQKNDLSQACLYYDKALAIRGDYEDLLGDYIYQLYRACKWDKIPALEEKLDARIKSLQSQNIPIYENPFTNIVRSENATNNYLVAKKWSEDLTRKVSRHYIKFDHSRKLNHDKVRVGYLSCDFYDHATAYLMNSFFDKHDKSKFDIYLYSYGVDDGSKYREKFQNNATHFFDVKEQHYLDTAKQIYNDEIDILVDLKGYTTGTRLEIAALKPAPIQISYLGFPGTCGGQFFDYIIADKVVIPQNSEQYFSEKIHYLENCYQVNDISVMPISVTKAKRSNYNLPEDAFIFASINQSYKITEEIFKTWLDIISEVDNSILWLYEDNEYSQENLKQYASSSGLDPSRIKFASHVPVEEFIFRSSLIDLALDTPIYNGHSTTSFTLLAGVPVVTLQGEHFASRVSSSILQSLDMHELVTHNLDEYKRLALDIATAPDKLKNLKDKLFNNVRSKPLFDTAQTVRNIEKFYLDII